MHSSDAPHRGHGSTQTLWSELMRPAIQPLTEDLRTDVCVVGAGIAGLTTAYLLARQGRDVVVLERERPGFGVTGATTAHLSNALDDRYYELQRLRGVKASKIAAESHTAAIEKIGEIASEEGIDCDYERLDGYLFVGEGQLSKELDMEYKAARRAGLKDVERLRTTPVPGLRGVPSLRFPDQGQFHPIRYLEGLSAAVERHGGRVLNGVHVANVDGGRRPHLRTSDERTITANAVVLATHFPSNANAIFYSQQPPYRSYVIGAKVRAGSVPRSLYWDTLDPYHYVRLASTEEGEFLIVGGEDHQQGHADTVGQHERLEAWTRKYFDIEQVRYRWSNITYESLDGLASIGPSPLQKNVYVVTGDSGMGMTHGTIAGIVLSQILSDQAAPWASAYDPARSPVSPMEFAKHNLRAAKKLGSWFTSGDSRSVNEIPLGEGIVVRRGLSKVAVYRDPQGVVHEMNAMCTHRGCVVAWNRTESTWDCPCHGSIFHPDGKVLHGPATRDLLPMKPGEIKKQARRAIQKRPLGVRRRSATKKPRSGSTKPPATRRGTP